MTIIYQNFMLPELKELQGFILIHAMTLILSWLRRAIFIGVDVVACGCIVHRTHNVLYAHKIAMYKEMTDKSIRVY